MSDISRKFESFTSKEDSIIKVNDFINNWARQKLLYEKSLINLPQDKISELSELVNNYESSLFRNAYKEFVLKSSMDTIMQQSLNQAYYERNKQNFILNEPVYRIRHISFPLDNVDRGEIINRFKRFNAEDVFFLDSLSFQFSSYFLADSIIILYQNPVLWTGENQVLSDTIAVHLSDSSVEKMDLKRNAFLISKDSVSNFNQIKGRLMNIYFQDQNLNYIDINGNCESLFHSMDETDTILLGINKMLTSNMTIRFLNNQIHDFTLYKSPEGRFIPPHMITETDKTLDKFNWIIERRPSLQDIFTKPVYDEILAPVNYDYDINVKPDEPEIEDIRKDRQEREKGNNLQRSRN